MKLNFRNPADVMQEQLFRGAILKLKYTFNDEAFPKTRNELIERLDNALRNKLISQEEYDAVERFPGDESAMFLFFDVMIKLGIAKRDASEMN